VEPHTKGSGLMADATDMERCENQIERPMKETGRMTNSTELGPFKWQMELNTEESLWKELNKEGEFTQEEMESPMVAKFKRISSQEKARFFRQAECGMKDNGGKASVMGMAACLSKMKVTTRGSGGMELCTEGGGSAGLTATSTGESTATD
jgi:hypothetical protein